MKIRFVIPALAATLIGPAMWAQSSAAKADPPATKVGVINIQVAITSTAEGKQAAAELQSQFAPRQSELDGMRKQIEEIEVRARTGQTTLSDEEKARLGAEHDKLTRSFQRKQQESQDDFQEAQREVVDRIGRKMISVLDNYARESGYSAILDTSSQNTPVVYAANQIDVTQEIIRLYDQNYPVKSSSGASKPAAKPAAKPPAQPGQQAPPKP